MSQSLAAIVITEEPRLAVYKHHRCLVMTGQAFEQRLNHVVNLQRVKHGSQFIHNVKWLFGRGRS